MTIRMKIKQIDTAVKTVLGEGKKMIDTNGDGRVSMAELKHAATNPELLGLLALAILSVLATQIKDNVILGIETGVFQTAGLVESIGTFLVPFLFFMAWKASTERADKRLKERDTKIKELENDLICEKWGRKEDASKAEIQMIQLEGAMQVKDSEILFIKEKYI